MIRFMWVAHEHEWFSTPEDGARPPCPPLLWLSDNPVWEPGSDKYTRTGRLMFFREMLAHYGPLYRVLVPERSGLTVPQFLAREPGVAHGIGAVCGGTVPAWFLRCPWRCSYEPIPAGRWHGIEVWSPEQAQWVAYHPEQG